MNQEIFVTKPYLPPFEEYVTYLKDVWDTHTLTNMGTYTRKFMEELQEFLSVEYCMPMSSGHMALEMMLEAMELSGEVITTPFTFASTTHAIVRNGLTPVFCDIREDDCTIDYEQIEALITDKTTAIVPVHIYGIPCHVERIQDIARRHNLKVIYDAAHAFGETINKNPIASYGDGSMFSFHATKAFNTIEGGCAVVKDMEVLKRIYQLHNFGIMDEEHVEFVGANAKMNEFEAIMGLCNLDHFEECRLKRKAVYEYYKQRLSQIAGIRLIESHQDVELNYTYCPILVDSDEYGMDRDELHHMLEENHIHARKYFYPLTNEFSCYANCDFKADVPVARRISRQILTLPLYTDMEMDVATFICDIIDKKGL